MPAAHVRTATAGLYGGSTTASATFSGVTSAGGLIAVGVMVTGDTIRTPTDSSSNVYVPIGAAELAGAFSVCRLFYALNVAGGTNIAVSAGLTGTGQFGGIVAHEVSGLDLVAPLDQEAQNAQTGTSTSVNAITSGADVTTTAGQYIFGMAADEAFTAGLVITAGSGFTQGTNSADDNGYHFSSEYQIQGAAGSIAATFTHAAVNDSVALMATFKAAAAGGAAPPPQRLGVLGVS